MYSNIALRLEVSGIYQKNTKVLNSLKGKQVLSPLQYITRTIFNQTKTLENIFKTVPCSEHPIIHDIPIIAP